MVQNPTVRELEALKILWDRKSATVREIFEAVDQGHGELAYTTILSLVQTMEQKGLLRRIGKTGKALRYVAAVRREKTLRGIAMEFLDRVFDGALNHYVLHAIDSEKLDAKEWEKINQLLRSVGKSKPARKDKP